MIENLRISFFNRKEILYVQYYIDGKCTQRSLRKPYSKENVKLAKKYVVPEIERKYLLGELTDKKKKAKNFSYYADLYLNKKKI